MRGQLYYQYNTSKDDAPTMQGSIVKLKPSDVLHIPGLEFDGLVGYSPIAMAKNAIGMGYEGDLELALIPESFRTEVLKESLDEKGVLIENAQVELESFALLFEFDGDQRHIRHVLYNCAASRPCIEGKTNEDTREVQTETLIIKATPLSNSLVKAKTGNTTDRTHEVMILVDTGGALP